MTKRRRIIHADKIIRNVFCLLMFLQLKDYYTVASNPLLLYSTSSDIRIANVSKQNKVLVIVKGLQQTTPAVDFLSAKSLICWSDQAAGLIQCMNYNETHSSEKMTIVTERGLSPTGVAIDWYTNKIYWTDSETNRVEVISIEDKQRKVLFWSDIDLARAIAVVPKDGLMFWSDWGEVPKIERAGMDGDPSTRKIVVKDDIFWPNGVTVDYKNNLIYWVDAKLKFIDVMDFNGENRKRVVSQMIDRKKNIVTNLEYPYALTFFDNKLYWTDWKIWAIYNWDISSNGPIKELLKSNPVPMDIKVYDTERQLMPTTDFPCKHNNGGCSHLCLLTPLAPGYTCACPTGVKIKEGSNTTCYDRPQSLLLVAAKSSISMISLDSPDFTPYELPLKDLKRAMAVDFDPNTEYIYWADLKTISRAHLDGTDQSVVIHTSGAPDSIAIDPLARNIYWTDPFTDTICVARLNGSSKKILIHEDLYDPRAIALHPTAGWMFWSDWNEKKPKIERANLDGTDRVLLISERLTWPNGIALDVENNKIYWGDARTRMIEVANMDGTGRTELQSTDILHIFGVTLLGNYIYWTDMQRRTLDRINKNAGEERLVVVEQMANMMGAKAFKLGEKIGWNACVDNNGGCSHFCFKRTADYVCSCPLGLELVEDKKTCAEPEAFLVYSRKNIIGRISIEHENNDAILPIKDLKEVSALAVHASGSKLYWSDSKTKTINRCSINGSNMEKILEWMYLVEGLAIDWSGQNIYWTDTVAQRIEVARLDGSSRRTLIWQGLKKPKSIVLDPRKGYMYWSELGSKTIKRAAMDGSSPTVLIENAGRVHALAIDYEKRAVYWAALDPPTIEYAFLNGTGKKVLADDISMPYALSLFEDKVFWGDWNTGLIETANKSDGANRKTIHTHLDYISDLKIYHKGRSGEGNQCGVDNGGCSHLCLPLPQNGGEADYRCACPAHYKLNKNNLTCSEPDEFLLFAQKNAVGRFVTGNSECNDAFISLTGLKNVRAIEYDPTDRRLYWMDEDSHSIRRVQITYSTTSAIANSSPVVSNICKPFHMVLDVLGRALYWTCMDKDSINATSIDNSTIVGVILKDNKMRPRHLAIHQTKRVLIWNDYGEGVIMRANMDGTQPSELASANNATALCVDQLTSTVYWAASGKIHAVQIDATNRRTVWQGGWAGALAAYSDALYFVNVERMLMRIPLARRDAPATPAAHVTRLVAATTVHKVPIDHPCYDGRACGREPGACLAGGACGCGLQCPGLDKSAGSGPAPCPQAHFQCKIDVQCVPVQWHCDGQVDCPDGSDEESCDLCAGGVRCVDGECADSLGACARGAYCPAGPLPHAFRCDERLCLSPALLCDGRQHCTDGSDEAPAVCVTHKDTWSTLGVCGGVVCAVTGAFAAWLAVRRWRRRRAPHARSLHALHQLQRAPLTKPHHDRVTPLGASHSTSATPTDNNTLTSESLCSRYPRPTANPPPSPATASGGEPAPPPPRHHPAHPAAHTPRRAYRHYRQSNRVPPPTPASTDACESEPEPAARAPPPSPAPLMY